MITDRFTRSLLWLSLLFLVGAIVALSFVGCASSGVTRTLQAGVVVAQGIDLHSTHAAIQSGHGREGNALLPSVWWQQGLIKMPITLGLLWATAQVEERGHKTLARIVLGVVSGALAIVSAHNYSIARGQ